MQDDYPRDPWLSYLILVVCCLGIVYLGQTCTSASSSRRASLSPTAPPPPSPRATSEHRPAPYDPDATRAASLDRARAAVERTAQAQSATMVARHYDELAQAWQKEREIDELYDQHLEHLQEERYDDLSATAEAEMAMERQSEDWLAAEAATPWWVQRGCIVWSQALAHVGQPTCVYGHIVEESSLQGHSAFYFSPDPGHLIVLALMPIEADLLGRCVVVTGTIEARDSLLFLDLPTANSLAFCEE